ncbi:MAG: hypothetical protein CVU72_00950 [Deltaproteobacteria bacterium HGW-Deltaproteobacteria-7]|jgi:protein TonB|nr:MAG: hypothetical protein CVU72_00950 [Deltaproteobacteria bacterium HGW-Deltaproteobacteria-7]PKN19329.1 MAG: hypothetical protein CVU71_07415 [Deltaproteobacteria bacterium HGW-Deltaproteobacteria-6]
MMAEKQNKLPGIVASLGLHGLAAVILIFSMPGNAMISRELGKLDFVWVSFTAGNKTSPAPARRVNPAKTQSAAVRTGSVSEVPAQQHFRVEAATTPALPEEAAYDKAPAAPGAKTAAYAAAGHPASDANRPAIASAAAPAFSRAYPLYRENPPPGYPEMARQQGYEGVVLVAAEILADGRVGKAVVRQSSGYAILDQTAVKAVRAWKFEPAKKSGIPYKTWAELPIKFVINENNSHS